MKLFIFSLLFSLFFLSTHSVTFELRNNCPFTIWAAAVPGGGRQLNQHDVWTLKVNDSTTGGRIWGRTNCYFDGSGHGRCETGDCAGLLECESYGTPPNTLAEYSLSQYNNSDFFDISLVDGFNVPMEFSPTSNGCKRRIRCAAHLDRTCPKKLRVQGGCHNPCTVFGTDRYCCHSGSCGPTFYSRFFKKRCPDVYSYPKDDQGSSFSCAGGTNYRVLFCP